MKFITLALLLLFMMIQFYCENPTQITNKDTVLKNDSTKIDSSIYKTDLSIDHVHCIYRNSPSDFNSIFNISAQFNVKYSGMSLENDNIDTMKILHNKVNWNIEKTNLVYDSLQWLGAQSGYYYSTKFDVNGALFPVDSFLLSINFDNGDTINKPFSTTIPGKMATKGYTFIYTEDYTGTVKPSYIRALKRPVVLSLTIESDTIITTFTTTDTLTYNGYVAFYDSDGRSLLSSNKLFRNYASHEITSIINNGTAINTDGTVNTVKIPLYACKFKTGKSKNSIQYARVCVRDGGQYSGRENNSSKESYNHRAISSKLYLTNNNNSVISPVSKDSIYSFAAIKLENYFIFRDRLPSDLYAFSSPSELYDNVSDKFTKFYSYEKAKNIRKQLSSSTIGFGFQVDSTGSGILIKHVTPGSPAQIAGLLRGDTIILIESKNVVNISYKDFSDMLKGENGTNKTLQIIRNNKKLEIIVTLAPYNVETVFSERIDMSTAYVKLTSFKRKTIEEKGSRVEFRKAIEKNQDAQNVILDLRRNGGGSVYQCRVIAGCFLPDETPMVSIEERIKTGSVYSTQKDTYRTVSDRIFNFDHIYILTDNKSASASELLITALQSNNIKVTLIGDTTYGKACSQRSFNGPDSTLAYITAATIWRFDGSTYHDIGIAPDISVPANEAKGKALEVISGRLAKKSTLKSQWSDYCLDCVFSEPEGLVD